jgi:hypothetical protein
MDALELPDRLACQGSHLAVDLPLIEAGVLEGLLDFFGGRLDRRAGGGLRAGRRAEVHRRNRGAGQNL